MSGGGLPRTPQLDGRVDSARGRNLPVGGVQGMAGGLTSRLREQHLSQHSLHSLQQHQRHRPEQGHGGVSKAHPSALPTAEPAAVRGLSGPSPAAVVSSTPPAVPITSAIRPRRLDEAIMMRHRAALSQSPDESSGYSSPSASGSVDVSTVFDADGSDLARAYPDADHSPSPPVHRLRRSDGGVRSFLEFPQGLSAPPGLSKDPFPVDEEIFSPLDPKSADAAHPFDAELQSVSSYLTSEFDCFLSLASESLQDRPSSESPRGGLVPGLSNPSLPSVAEQTLLKADLTDPPPAMGRVSYPEKLPDCGSQQDQQAQVPPFETKQQHRKLEPRQQEMRKLQLSQQNRQHGDQQRRFQSPKLHSSQPGCGQLLQDQQRLLQVGQLKQDGQPQQQEPHQQQQLQGQLLLRGSAAGVPVSGGQAQPQAFSKKQPLRSWAIPTLPRRSPLHCPPSANQQPQHPNHRAPQQREWPHQHQHQPLQHLQRMNQKESTGVTEEAILGVLRQAHSQSVSAPEGLALSTASAPTSGFEAALGLAATWETETLQQLLGVDVGLLSKSAGAYGSALQSAEVSCLSGAASPGTVAGCSASAKEAQEGSCWGSELSHVFPQSGLPCDAQKNGEHCSHDDRGSHQFQGSQPVPQASAPSLEAQLAALAPTLPGPADEGQLRDALPCGWPDCGARGIVDSAPFGVLCSAHDALFSDKRVRGGLLMEELSGGLTGAGADPPVSPPRLSDEDGDLADGFVGPHSFESIMLGATGLQESFGDDVFNMDMLGEGTALDWFCNRAMLAGGRLGGGGEKPQQQQQQQQQQQPAPEPQAQLSRKQDGHEAPTVDGERAPKKSRNDTMALDGGGIGPGEEASGANCTSGGSSSGSSRSSPGLPTPSKPPRVTQSWIRKLPPAAQPAYGVGNPLGLLNAGTGAGAIGGLACSPSSSPCVAAPSLGPTSSQSLGSLECGSVASGHSSAMLHSGPLAASGSDGEGSVHSNRLMLPHLGARATLSLPPPMAVKPMGQQSQIMAGGSSNAPKSLAAMAQSGTGSLTPVANDSIGDRPAGVSQAAAPFSQLPTLIPPLVLVPTFMRRAGGYGLPGVGLASQNMLPGTFFPVKPGQSPGMQLQSQVQQGAPCAAAVAAPPPVVKRKRGRQKKEPPKNGPCGATTNLRPLIPKMGAGAGSPGLTKGGGGGSGGATGGSGAPARVPQPLLPVFGGGLVGLPSVMVPVMLPMGMEGRVHGMFAAAAATAAMQQQQQQMQAQQQQSLKQQELRAHAAQLPLQQSMQDQSKLVEQLRNGAQAAAPAAKADTSSGVAVPHMRQLQQQVQRGQLPKAETKC